MPIKKDRIRERGFTLLEVLIAISLFSVGVLAVAAMQGSATRGNRLGNELTQATTLAQMQIEALKSTDTSSGLDTALPTGDYSDANNPIDEKGDPGGIFTRSWRIDPNTAFSRLVTVTVSWTIGTNTHNVVLSTVTRGGGN